MGYAFYTVFRDGEEINAGYGVDDTCNRDDCDEQIDRGVGYLCGATPGGDEYGCGHYFCDGHLYGPPADSIPQLCESCRDRWLREQRSAFADELALVIGAMPVVARAGVLAERPHVFVELTDGRAFEVTVT